MNKIIVWFRRDLRLHDNPALSWALGQQAAVLPVYIHSPAEEGTWAPGGASRWWLHHSLLKLADRLEQQEIMRAHPKLVAACQAVLALDNLPVTVRKTVERALALVPF